MPECKGAGTHASISANSPPLSLLPLPSSLSLVCWRVISRWRLDGQGKETVEILVGGSPAPAPDVPLTEEVARSFQGTRDKLPEGERLTATRTLRAGYTHTHTHIHTHTYPSADIPLEEKNGRARAMIRRNSKYL